MMSRFACLSGRQARFPGSLMPSLYFVAKHSTRLATWNHVMDRPPQQSQPSTSWLAVRPDSGLAELPRLFRSH